MFIKDRLVNEVAKDLLPLFKIGDFHSDMPIRDIIPAALDALKDRGLPARMNLAGLVSKRPRVRVPSLPPPLGSNPTLNPR